MFECSIEFKTVWEHTFVVLRCSIVVPSLFLRYSFVVLFLCCSSIIPCSLTVPLFFLRCFCVAPSMFLRCSLVFHGCSFIVPSLFLRCSIVVPSLFLRYSSVVLFLSLFLYYSLFLNCSIGFPSMLLCRSFNVPPLFSCFSWLFLYCSFIIPCYSFVWLIWSQLTPIWQK